MVCSIVCDEEMDQMSDTLACCKSQRISNTCDHGSTQSTLHCGEILGFDITATSDAGPLFRIPVTVVKPRRCDQTMKSLWTRVTSQSRKLNRFYMSVPRGATWADLHVEAGEYVVVL